MRTVTEDQFVIEQVGVMPHASFASGTARNMSGAALRRAQKRHEEKLRAWHAAAGAAREEYKRQVVAGLIRPPSNIERLLQRAQGHPDNPSVQAARRVLRRRGYVVKAGPAMPRLSRDQHRAMELYHLGGAEAWRSGTDRSKWVRSNTVAALMRGGYFTASGLTEKGRRYIEEHVKPRSVASFGVRGYSMATRNRRARAWIAAKSMPEKAAYSTGQPLEVKTLGKAVDTAYRYARTVEGYFGQGEAGHDNIQNVVRLLGQVQLEMHRLLLAKRWRV